MEQEDQTSGTSQEDESQGSQGSGYGEDTGLSSHGTLGGDGGDDRTYERNEDSGETGGLSDADDIGRKGTGSAMTGQTSILGDDNGESSQSPKI